MFLTSVNGLVNKACKHFASRHKDHPKGTTIEIPYPSCPQTTFPYVAVGKGSGNTRLFQILLYIHTKIKTKIQTQGNQISYKSPLQKNFNKKQIPTTWRTLIRKKTLEISKLSLVRRFHCMPLICYECHT